jgi:hypothetical protein
VTTRIVVDPNRESRRHPGFSFARLEAVDPRPRLDERVLAVQPYEGEPDVVGDAVVRMIDDERGLIYLEVDWESFRDEVAV